MNTMHYKGYEAIVAFDEDAELFHGEVAGIRDVVTFQGVSVDDLKTAFGDSIDDYLAFCAERGEEPDEPSRPHPSRSHRSEGEPTAGPDQAEMVEIVVDLRGLYRHRLTTKNGELLFTSEGFASKSEALAALGRLRETIDRTLREAAA